MEVHDVLHATPWNSSPTEFIAMLSALRASIYPSGNPTNGVDSIVRDSGTYTKPVGCSQIDIYTVDNPGGRIGGTSLNTQLLIPTATPNGSLIVMYGGHNSLPGSWENYVQNDGTSIVLPLLALGYHALMVDSPATGYQPIPQEVFWGGSVQVIGPTAHAYAGLDSDGGPPSWRMFLDYTIRSINQAITDFGITRIVGSGESGGGIAIAMLAAVDGRFAKIAPCQGGLPVTFGWHTPIGSTEWEQCLGNPTYALIPGCDYSGAIGMAAVAGCDVLVCNGTTDTTFPVRDWIAFAKFWGARNSKITTGSIDMYQSPDGHAISAAEATKVSAWLQG